MKAPYDKALEVIAKGCGLDPKLVRAIVQVESSGNPNAIRYEPKFYERYIKNSVIYPVQEHRLLASSLGLMQVMGVVAREHGFQRALKELFIPEIGLLYGCLHMAKFQEKYKRNLEEAIAAYNAGTVRYRKDGTFVNQSYVDKILEVLKELNSVKGFL